MMSKKPKERGPRVEIFQGSSKPPAPRLSTPPPQKPPPPPPTKKK